MLLGAFRAADKQDETSRPQRHGLWVLVATAIGTSLDSMAVGVSLAFLDTNIMLVVGAIGLVTFILATAGMLVGRLVGGKLGRWAEGLGGLCLIAIGLGILVEHVVLA